MLNIAGALYTVYSFNLGIYGICAALSAAQFIYFLCFSTYFFTLKSQRRYEFYRVEGSTVKSCVKQVVLFIKTILFAISIRIFIEVGTVVTGFLSEQELAAQSILLRYAMVIISLTFSLSTVPITHMGRAAGQAEHRATAPPSDAHADADVEASDSAHVNAHGYGSGGHQHSDTDADSDAGSGSIQAGPEMAGSGVAALRGRTAFLLFFRATLNIYLVISVFVAVFLTLLRTQLAKFSTSIESVANLVDSLTPYVTIFVVLQIVWQALCSIAFSRSITFFTIELTLSIRV